MPEILQTIIVCQYTLLQPHAHSTLSTHLRRQLVHSLYLHQQFPRRPHQVLDNLLLVPREQECHIVCITPEARFASVVRDSGPGSDS